jgi:hypothetical protein
MRTLTIRVPDSKHHFLSIRVLKHSGLKHLAKSRGVSLNKPIEELSTVAVAQHDAEMRFRILAAPGSQERGLKLLDKLDRAFAKSPRA